MNAVREATSSTVDTFRVLHIDGDPATTDDLTTATEQTDGKFDVSATEPQAGLDSLQKSSFDCIVSSYELPGTNGLALFEAVREQGRTIPFILYADPDSEGVAERALAAGVSGYVQTGETAVLANRIETEVRRRRNEQSARQTIDALEAIRDGIAIFDSDGQFQYVNEAYASVYGYSPEELVGGSWDQLYPESEIEHYKNEILPTLQSEGGWIGDCECLHRDGFQFRSTHSISDLEEGGHICVIHHGTVKASDS